MSFALFAAYPFFEGDLGPQKDLMRDVDMMTQQCLVAVKLSLRFNQGELNGLIRNLNSSKETFEVLTFRQNEKNLLQPDTTVPPATEHRSHQL